MIDILKRPEIQRNILIISIIIMLSMFKKCSSDKDLKIFKNEQNISALNDSIRKTVTKNGELEFNKLSYIATEKELKKVNKELLDEIEYLKGNPITVIKVETVIVNDTIPAFVSPNGDLIWNPEKTVATQKFDWSIDKKFSKGNFRKIKGSYVVETDLKYNLTTYDFMVESDSLGFSLTTGLKETDGKLEIFVKSENPGFVPTSIEGTLLDPRDSDIIKKFFPQKRWSLGAYGGYGIYIDPLNGRAGTGINLGVGVQYNLIKF